MESGAKKKEITKGVIRYVLTPQIVPRIKNLFFSGFSHVAFFMAQIYRGARLLPSGHPYLNPANVGLYGIRHVIVEAGSNLVMSRKNIDQIIIYIMMIIGMVILFAQICMLMLAVSVQSAKAWTVNLGGPVPSTFAAYYLLPDATHDVAFVMLDRVFGVPGLFTDSGGGATCVVQGIPCFDIGQSSREITPDLTIYTNYDRTATLGGYVWPWGFHRALQDMFAAYSMGMIVVATFIIMYFVIAVVAETAQSGTPFGRRFNHVWAPLRIVAAVGLLIPMTNGLNSAQYILLYAAKFGSGLASNGWVLFNNASISGTDTLLGTTDTLVALPSAPPVNTLIEFATILATCKVAYERMYHDRDDRDQADIQAWLVNPQKSADPLDFATTPFLAAVDFFDKGDITVRFGEKRGQADPNKDYQTNDGGVSALCGEVILQMTSPPEDISAANQQDPGASYILTWYYTLLQQLWADARGGFISCPYISSTATPTLGLMQQGCIGYNVSNRYLPIANDPNAPLPDAAVLDAIRKSYQQVVIDIIAEGVLRQQNSTEWLEQLTALGWGGAAIWYNKVAQMNGSLIGAAYNLPTIKKYPEVMEYIRKTKAAADKDTPGTSRHQVYQSTDTPVVFRDEEEKQIAEALNHAQRLWKDHYFEQKKGGNIWIDVVNAIFGTNGLFDMQKNADQRVHPLAQLSAIGRSIIDTAIRNLGFSAAAGLGGGIINMFGEHMVGQVAMVASGFLSQIAITGLTIGFVLFYIIPLLPFIYFFFALGSWIKGIFEAMVGVPLWALAHIRIDGNGLPGDAALGGYQLILEIFLRPILILFGFLASITIFSAQVQILHEIWPLVVSNSSGFDVDAATSGVYDPHQTGGISFLRGAIDKFFFTVIYAIVVYMLGMSAFKMIDLVPNHILRWIGANISSFGDQSGDPAENLVRNSTIGANMVTGPMGGAISNLKGAASSGGKALGELTAPKG